MSCRFVLFFFLCATLAGCGFTPGDASRYPSHAASHESFYVYVTASTGASADPFDVYPFRFREDTGLDPNGEPFAAPMYSTLQAVPGQPFLLQTSSQSSMRTLVLNGQGEMTVANPWVPGGRDAVFASNGQVYVTQSSTNPRYAALVRGYTIASDGQLTESALEVVPTPWPIYYPWPHVVPVERAVSLRTVQKSQFTEQLWLAVTDCTQAQLLPSDCTSRAMSFAILPSSGRIYLRQSTQLEPLLGGDGEMSLAQFVGTTGYLATVQGIGFAHLQTYSEVAGGLTFAYCGEPPYPDLRSLTALQADPSGAFLYALMDDGRLYLLAIDAATHCVRLSQAVVLSSDRALRSTRMTVAGDLLFVVRQPWMSVWRLNAETGTLTEIARGVLNATPSSIAVVPVTTAASH